MLQRISIVGFVFVNFVSASAALGQGRVIEEVIVTAQKKAQNLQDVPISVASFESDFINDKAISDIGELVQYTPNVKFNASQGHSPVLTIRGFGTPPLGRGLEPSVGLSIDDVFYGRATYINDTAFDMARMEVLRGPQGTLFGKNTIAGVFSITTGEPDFDSNAYINLAKAKYNDLRAEGAVSFPIIEDKLAARIALRSRYVDSHVYNTARNEQNEIEDLGGRLKLKWFISESSVLLLNFWASKHREVGLITQIAKASPRSKDQFRDPDVGDPEFEDDPWNNTTSMDSPTFSDRDTVSANIKYTKDWGDVGYANDFNMTFIAAMSEFEGPYAIDGDFSPIDFINFGTDPNEPNYYEQQNVEVRFGGTLPGLFGIGRGIDFLIGAFAAETQNGTTISQTNGVGFAAYIAGGGAIYDPQSDFAFFPSAPFPLTLDDEDQGERLFASTAVETESVAYFMQYDWLVTDTLTFVLGLRYGEDKRVGNISSGKDGLPGAGPFTTGQEDFDVVLKGSDYDFTPKLTVSWEVLEDLTIFATYTQGFKSGGFAAAVFTDDNLTFEPETADAYEIGFKSKLFDGSLIFNGAFFHTQYADLQVRNFDGTKIFVTNAADATTTGFEFDFFWLPPVPYLSIGGSGGIVDAKYAEYLCAVPVAGTASGTGDPSCYNENTGPQDDPTAPSFQDLSDQPLAFAPEKSASLFTSLDMPLLNTGINLLLGVDAIYQGKHFTDTDNDPFSRQEATTKVNARIGIKEEGGRWSLVFNAKNLTRQKENALTLDQPLISGNYIYASLPDEPSYHLDFRYTVK
ncbi:MAG: iron complex outermembrane receptor protein [Zhongshania sp.]|jgi:iron complex outermembrane receptor protein